MRGWFNGYSTTGLRRKPAGDCRRIPLQGSPSVPVQTVRLQNVPPVAWRRSAKNRPFRPRNDESPRQSRPRPATQETTPCPPESRRTPGCLSHTSFAKGDHRLAPHALCFQRDNAEILVAGRSRFARRYWSRIASFDCQPSRWTVGPQRWANLERSGPSPMTIRRRPRRLQASIARSVVCRLPVPIRRDRSLREAGWRGCRNRYRPAGRLRDLSVRSIRRFAALHGAADRHEVGHAMAGGLIPAADRIKHCVAEPRSGPRRRRQRNSPRDGARRSASA